MKEIRIHAGVELRAGERDGKPALTGYAAVFGTRSLDLGGFVETVRAGAFSRAIREQQDVRALIDHNATLILGRTKSGTLILGEDSRGLSIDVALPDTQAATDLLKSINRGDVDQMSFAFRTIRDDWRMDEGRALRELIDVDLLDVSAVTYPAYPDTSVATRSMSVWRQKIEPRATGFLTINQARQRQALAR